MRRLVLLAALALITVPLAGQQPVTPARRPRPVAFPLSVIVSLGLNFGGSRALAPDPLVPVCTAGSGCLTHGLGSGPGGGVELQVPLVGTLGLGLAADVARFPRERCVAGGSCASPDKTLAFRGRAQLLVRLKARAPVYFGFGVAAMRSDPPIFLIQNEPTMEIGGAVTVGVDLVLTPRVGVRLAWTTFLLQPDDTDVPNDWEMNRLAHDGLLTIGARLPIRR